MSGNAMNLGILFAVLTVILIGIAAVTENYNTRREVAPMAAVAALMSFVTVALSVLSLAGVFG